MQDYQTLLIKLTSEWPQNDIVNFVFMGDSITAGYRVTPHVDLLASYPAQFMTWLNRRFPTASVNLINAGVGGWGVKEAAGALDRHVLCHHPDFVSLCYGMNDFHQGRGYLEPFRATYRQIIDRLLSTGVSTLLLMTTMPYYQHPDPALQPEFMETVRGLAKEYRLPLADVYAGWLERQARYSDPQFLYSNGCNHPSDPGHAIYAHCLISAFTQALGISAG